MEEEEKSVDEIVEEIVNGARGGEWVECSRCGASFQRPEGSRRKLCKNCFSASVSRGVKESKARRKQIREARKTQPIETCLVRKPEPKPEEAAQILADGIRHERRDCLLGLYQALTDVARDADLTVTEIIERLAKIDEAVR